MNTDKHRFLNGKISGLIKINRIDFDCLEIRLKNLIVSTSLQLSVFICVHLWTIFLTPAIPRRPICEISRLPKRSFIWKRMICKML